jgi:tetratricopeptide (TPR) repeat protein
MRQAIKLKKDSAEGHYLLARLLFETNDSVGSQRVLDEALKHDPSYAPSYGLKGDLEVAERKHKVAINSYGTALRLAPPGDEGVSLIRERVMALRHYIEFKSKNDDPSYQMPTLLNAPRPNYTVDARKNRVTGSVLMALLVDETGAVHSHIIFKRLGYGLDEEAARARGN